MNELFWPRSRSAPPAEPVKTQIAARLIVMLGYAPELGFERRAQKQGNEIVTRKKKKMGWEEEYSALQDEVDVTAGLYRVRRDVLGERR